MEINLIIGARTNNFMISNNHFNFQMIMSNGQKDGTAVVKTSLNWGFLFYSVGGEDGNICNIVNSQDYKNSAEGL